MHPASRRRPVTESGRAAGFRRRADQGPPGPPAAAHRASARPARAVGLDGRPRPHHRRSRPGTAAAAGRRARGAAGRPGRTRRIAGAGIRATLAAVAAKRTGRRLCPAVPRQPRTPGWRGEEPDDHDTVRRRFGTVVRYGTSAMAPAGPPRPTGAGRRDPPNRTMAGADTRTGGAHWTHGWNDPLVGVDSPAAAPGDRAGGWRDGQRRVPGRPRRRPAHMAGGRRRAERGCGRHDGGQHQAAGRTPTARQLRGGCPRSPPLLGRSPGRAAGRRPGPYSATETRRPSRDRRTASLRRAARTAAPARARQRARHPLGGAVPVERVHTVGPPLGGRPPPASCCANTVTVRGAAPRVPSRWCRWCRQRRCGDQRRPAWAGGSRPAVAGRAACPRGRAGAVRRRIEPAGYPRSPIGWG